jgi:site-specific recombinase XerD
MSLLRELNKLLHNPDDDIPLEERIRREREAMEPTTEPTEPTLGPEQAIAQELGSAAIQASTQELVQEVEPEEPESLGTLRAPTSGKARKERARNKIYKPGKNKFDLNLDKIPADLKTGVGDYIRHIINNRGFSEWTVHSYKMAFGWFFEWVVGYRETNPGFSPMAMDLKDADSFKFWLIDDREVTPLYTNCIVLALKSLYSFLFVREYMTRNAFAHLEIVKERIAEMRNPPPRGQVLEIINRFADTDPKKMIFTLAYFSGLRRSEIVSVTRSDFTGEKIKDREIIYIKVLGKGNKERTTLVYDAEGVKMLQDQLAANDAGNDEVLVGLHVDYVSHIVEKESSIPDVNKAFTTHSMRHAYATNLRNLGVAIDVIAKFLGHSNLTTTQIYMHLKTEDAMKEVLAKL